MISAMCQKRQRPETQIIFAVSANSQYEKSDRHKNRSKALKKTKKKTH